MIKNKRELNTCVAQWGEQALNDMISNLREFIRMTNATPEEIAFAIDVDTSIIERLVRADRTLTLKDISLEDFARFLISTDHILAIERLDANTNYPRPSGRMVAENEQVTRREHGECACDSNQTETNNAPLRDPATGRFMSRREAVDKSMPDLNRESECHSMPQPPTRERMEFDMHTNGWDREVEMDEMSDMELLRFLAERTRGIMPSAGRPQSPRRQESRSTEMGPRLAEIEPDVAENDRRMAHLRNAYRQATNGERHKRCECHRSDETHLEPNNILDVIGKVSDAIMKNPKLAEALNKFFRNN